MVCFSPAFLASRELERRLRAERALLATLMQSLSAAVPNASSSAPAAPPVADGVLLVVLVPGYRPEELSIEIAEDRIHLYGRKSGMGNPAGQAAPSVEFKRSLALPFRVQRENVRVQYRNGLLEIYLQRPGSEADGCNRLGGL